jgi:hypothetical protein
MNDVYQDFRTVGDRESVLRLPFARPWWVRA